MSPTARRTARRATATLGAAALLTAATSVVADPAHADPEKERTFRVAGAVVDFKVEKERGRFDIDIDLDARPGSRWIVVLKHDAKRVLKRTYRADAEGEVEINKLRRNTKGKDRFKVWVKKTGGASASRTIVMR
ncbi:hypothetical protein JK386_17600 [Nocardioides sp. zg-536]|uniref:Uncharacterized protein n=1 Tax=Nocardioides faecalis TaxID=2803858 RepID=A0A939BXG7_9ACTN|nr:hypothetical protein [Nocardioides faecalis]MBM9461712.1 hypothetical protein [Nocardioides faecalis]QVI60152.1 hypothetical protein KG111_07595 [Nocardioides faecalis]